LALKAALRAIHEGPYAIPRKVVVAALGIHESNYSRWMDDAQSDLPGVTDLMVIITVAQNPGPLQAMATYCGEGYVVLEDLSQIEESGTAKGLRLQNLEADSDVDLTLAKDLEDGRLDKDEALDLIPKLEARAEVNRRTLELARRVAKTGIAAGGLQ
jgi:hypothetical protein